MPSQNVMIGVPKTNQCGPYAYEICWNAELAHDYDHSGVCLFRSRRISLDTR